MNSLPLMTDIIRPGELSTIVFFEVRPVADFMNTMYWHDTLDKSLISQGSVNISRVYHCTYAGFIKRKDTNELSVMHYDGTFVAHDQIVTVVEFVAQIGKEGDKKKEEASLTGTAWPSAASSFLSLKKAAAVFHWKEKQCKTCSEYSGVKDSTLKSSMCATCDDLGSNWSRAVTVSKPAARPEPENIDDKITSGGIGKIALTGEGGTVWVDATMCPCLTCSKSTASGWCDNHYSLLNVAHTYCPEWRPRDCKSCAMPTAFVKKHRALIPIGLSDIVVPRECRECGSLFMSWSPK